MPFQPLEPTDKIYMEQIGGDVYIIHTIDEKMRAFVSTLPYWQNKPQPEGIYGLRVKVSPLYSVSSIRDQLVELTEEDYTDEFQKLWAETKRAEEVVAAISKKLMRKAFEEWVEKKDDAEKTQQGGTTGEESTATPGEGG